MPILDPQFATRRRLKVGLAIAGAVAGALFGMALTTLGKLATGAPPATTANYLWNATVFGVMAGVVSPLISWTMLRRVPLWRTVVEPLAYAIAGGCAALLLGVPFLLLLLPPIGLGLGVMRLVQRYPDPESNPQHDLELRKGTVGVRLNRGKEQQAADTRNG